MSSNVPPDIRNNNEEYNANRTKAPNIVLLEDVRSWLKVKDGDTRFDGILNILIESVSQEFENFIDAPIIIRKFFEVADGDISDTIVPLNKPVRKIISIILDPEGDFDDLETSNKRFLSALRVPDNDFFIDTSGSIRFQDSTLSILGTTTTGQGIGTILLEYEAGWAQTVSDVPSDIKLAALQRIEHLWQLRENRNLDITSKSAGDSRITRVQGLPLDIQEVLNRYIDMSFDNANTRVRKFQVF